MERVIHGKETATYYENLISARRFKDCHDYSTRNSDKLILPYCRTDKAKQDLMYSAVYYWNSLPLHIRMENDSKIFAKVLKEYMLLEPFFFNMCICYLT